MAIDLNSEELLSLTDAARALPKVGGKRPHTSTVWRWARKGLRGVRLEYVRLGHRVCTSRQALGRFAQRLADVDELQSNEGAARSRSGGAFRANCIAGCRKCIGHRGLNGREEPSTHGPRRISPRRADCQQGGLW